MILDALTKLSDAQQVTADAVSADKFDNGAETPGRRLAVGEAMAIVFNITAVGTTTGSLFLEAVHSANSDLSASRRIGVIDLVTADIAVGNLFVVPLSQGLPGLRYVGANYDVTGVVDATFDAFLMPLSMVSTFAQAYAKGYVIS